MLLHDLFDWTNSGVGAAGLALTLATLFLAKGAKKAAIEARKAVYRRNAADAMVEIVRIAEQLNTAVLYERRIEASLQFRELVYRIPKDREEFANHLGADVDKLRSVESSCILWSDFLSSGEFPLSTAEKKHLFNETLNAVQTLSAIQGRLRRVLDQEES